MIAFLKKSALISLLPLAFICFQYNQCHGYFAERYDVLLLVTCVILSINIVLSLCKASYTFATSCWLVILLPSFSASVFIEIITKLITLLFLFIVTKKLSCKFLTFVFGIIVCFNVIQIIQRDLVARRIANDFLKQQTNDIKNDFQCNQNIYWIVCDACTSFYILKNHYHFDNTQFYNQLRQLKFSTIDGQLPYKDVNPFPTLKALNFYTNFNRFDVTKPNALTLHYCLKDNLLFNIFAKNGYNLFVTLSRFPFLHKIKHVNVLGENYISSYLQFLYHCCKQNKFFKKLISKKLNEQLYFHQEKVFNFLRSNLPITDKCFYYIHIDSPHAPFVRDNNNIFNNDQQSVVWGENEVGKTAYSLDDYKQGYIEQLQGLTIKILELLNTINQKDPAAIVVLQGDHGTFTTTNSQEQQSFLFAVKNVSFEPKATENFFKHFIYGRQ